MLFGFLLLMSVVVVVASKGGRSADFQSAYTAPDWLRVKLLALHSYLFDVGCCSV
jgi:hypothetical protein